MKKLIFGLLLLALVLPISGLAQAPNSASVDVRQNIRDGRSAINETRLQAMGVQMTIRLTAVVTRTENLIKRVEAVVARTSASARYDVSLVNSKLATAKQAAEKAKASVNKINDEIKKALENTDSTIAMDEVRTMLRSAVSDVKVAHQNTVEAIIIIRGGTTGATPTTN